MPKYQIEAPDGRKITVEMDRPPTQEDAENIIQQAREEYDTNLASQQKNQQVNVLRGQAQEMRQNRPQRIAEAQQESFQEMPWYDQALAGAGSVAYSTPGIKQAYDVAGMLGAPKPGDKPEDYERYRTASQGSGWATAGEIGADVAEFAIPASQLNKLKYLKRLKDAGKIKGAMGLGAMAGAGSAAMHQAQNLQTGRKLDPIEAGVEVGASALLPGAGMAVGRGFKKVAPEILQSAIKPVLAQTDAVNPPNFELPLKEKLVGRVGGLNKSHKITREKIQALSGLRETAEDMKKTIPITHNKVGVFGQIGDDIKKTISDPKSKITKSKQDDIIETIQEWQEQIKSRPTFKNGHMTIEDAINFRQAIDKEIAWRKSTQSASKGFNQASKMLRKKLNDVIAERSPVVGELTKEMAKVIPYEKALERRILNQMNNYKMGLLDIGAFSGGAFLGGGSGEDGGSIRNRAMLGLGLLGARRMTSTPGGARMIYDMGRNLTTPSRVKDIGMQTGRATGANLYGGNQ